jgi:hypothetical protein
VGGEHRAPRRRGPLAAAAVLVLVVTLAGAYRAHLAQRAPDTAAAGPGYWVSTRGSDDAAGSSAHPWRTIGHAVTAAPAAARIFVRNGTYEPFTVTKAGLTITSAPGERAVVQGSREARDVIHIAAADVTVSDLTVRGCVPNPNPDVDVTGDHGSGIRIASAGGVTVRGVTVRDSHGTNAAGLPVGCYGILATDSHDVVISGSEVYHNGAGIVISGGGKDVVVELNDVHDQDVIVQNSAAADDDFGGYGLAATFVKADPGPVFRHNTVRRNAGPSADYGVDGGGIELYDARNTTISDNTFAANNGVMETGTGSGGACTGNTFTGNTATTDGEPADADTDTGLVLRCAAGLQVTGNTFSGLANFTFLLTDGGEFAGRIDGVRITGNTVVRRTGAVVFRLQYAGGAPPGVTIDQNRYRTGQDSFAVIDPGSPETTVSFAGWRSRTGHDASSTLF